MRIKTNLIGDWKHIADEKSTFDVIIGDTYSLYLMGRAIKDGDRLSVSVNEFGEVYNSRTHVQAQMIMLFSGTQKATLTVKGFV